MSFVLPGAEQFSAYLQSIVKGELTVEGPKVLDWSWGVEYTKRWIVKLDDEILGEYFTFGPKPKETDFGRQYDGRIPEYVNKAIEKGNLCTGEKCPVDKVILSWSNIKCVMTGVHELSKIITVPWGRQDGHTAIPFP